MALLLSSTDVAIAVAIKAGDLAVTAHVGRAGPYVAISDAVGLIEVHLSAAEAEARIAGIKAALQ